MRITKADLDLIKAKRAEIEKLEKNIYALNMVVSDTVRGSSAEHPWTQHTITIEGADVQTYSKHIKQLNKKREELGKDIAAYTKKLEEIEDDTVKTMLMLKILSGFSDAEIGSAMGYTRQRVKQIIDNYIQD